LTVSGIRRVRFHDARHTFASLLLQQGESPAYVKDQLGHSSIQMTVDVYGHLIPGLNKQAVDKLDDPGYTGGETAGADTKSKPGYM
jgi:integrase